ncbi:PAR12-like protein [Mya arenaria]|uniref:PAR12-like protein n=1 Tax=Mya arenaria TaxID=6604 RepID=A0ABY7F0F2_MYAAR|nr:PAR12-like protein [Mya arenaria]
MAMAIDQDKDDIVRRVIRFLASQPNYAIGFADLHANFNALMEGRQFERLLRNYTDQFELFEDGQLFVRLSIKVKVCEMHCSNQTCPGNISVCKGLHICKRYILYGNCTHNPCIVGHDLTTSHNMEVLSQLLLNQLPMPLVEDLLKRPTKICEFYNMAGGCRNNEAGKPCTYLHLCKNYITRECITDNCQRSHFIHKSTVRNVLEKHGISMGKIPKKNLAEFKKIMQNAATKICEFYNKNGGCRNDKNGKPCPYLHLCKNYITRECVTENCQRSHFIHESTVRNVLEKHGISKYRSSQDTEISLESRCSYFAQCFNYHCELLYQWFYRFDDSSNWKTVEPLENMRMELHYSDPANVEYCLFIEDVSVQLKFKTMKAEGEGKHLTFHRVSTESSAILDSHPLATSWQWFWMAENGHRSKISSEDLEQAYISNPDGQLKFSTQEHEYKLDFAKMVQCNIHHKTEREVSRRPKFVSKDELERRKKQPVIQKPAGSATSGFVPVAPPHWNLRRTDELLNHCELVLLDERNPSMNTEYNEIENIKKDKLKKRNKGVDVEERQLFHGTSNDTVEAIYRQGFDFRLSGTASGTAYGKGSYFATTAKYSNCYTDRQKETMGMFIAKVLVGDYTKGDKSYSRPPQKDPHDLSSPLYDSCVDSVIDPKIFVIFELGQVYPEYLIKYKSDFSP